MTINEPAIGKVVINYINNKQEKFTESPFYVKANLLVSGNEEPLRATIQKRIYTAVAQMTEVLSANDIESIKVVYEIELNPN